MPPRYRRRTAEEIAFQREVARALDGLPEWVRRHLENVAVVIEEEPSPEDKQGMEERLYALYHGVPLGVEAGPFALPARIILFRRPLIEDYGRGSRLRREIRRTIIHEVGHHFGMSEEDIARLGYD